jgi:hypothetical protein
MKLSETQIKTIAAALGAMVLFGMYLTLFTIIKNKNNQISALQNQVDMEVRKDQRLHSVKLLMTDLNKELEMIDAHFVSDNGVVDFLESLEALGSVSGASVSVNSVSVNKDKDVSLPYELLKLEFVARGSWVAVVQLISLLDAFPLGITIERMQLERIPNSNSWQINTSFNVLKLK